ncbi:hypothetical protein DFQ27_009351 [Actinomortierella ambigua]|uniref:S-adenosylmethionine:tRNA ribosyltransferase-isomerase n=1 Tax=Actinomortierella ambigua TaxID=1343610 RepID=A0A9P6U9V4_9FUNG|nr:hypothetical protein DFQ27_009351 [Actinomortierella ambigua]
MKTADFDFSQNPAMMPSDPVDLRGKTRESGRMVVLDRGADAIIHTVFSSIIDYLHPGDLLVLNDSYILSNTLEFNHGDTSMLVSLLGHEPDGTTILDLKGKFHPQPGITLTCKDDPQLSCTLISQRPNALWKARFEPFERLVPTLDAYGTRVDKTIHLDPTLWQTKNQSYRSVYAKTPGSLDIPSAGLHFSAELLDSIVRKGVEIAYITLHVGTTEDFAVSLINAEEIENHKMTAEYFEVGDEAAAQINRAMAEKRRIVGVGTTVLRTLESLAVFQAPKTPIQAKSGWTDLYIYPGFEFKVVDALLTNLHRPRSSHIVLTAAFAGKEIVMRSYAEILEMGEYEFDLFGDSMLLV